MCVLQYDAQRTAQIRFADLVDVDAVIPDLAILDIIETVDQVGDRRLAGTGRTDQSDLLPWLRIHPDVMQDHLVFFIAKVYAIKHDAAFQRELTDQLADTIHAYVAQ